jgi:hypothetical protein
MSTATESTPAGAGGSETSPPGRPTSLPAVGDGDLHAVAAPRLLGREEDAAGERQARQRHGQGGRGDVVEDADERRTAVRADDDLVAERDVLDVHRDPGEGSGARAARGPIGDPNGSGG